MTVDDWAKNGTMSSEHLERMAQVGLTSTAMIHDLDNALQAVTGLLELLANKTPDNETVRHLALIRHGLARCSHMTRHLGFQPLRRHRPPPRLKELP